MPTTTREADPIPDTPPNSALRVTTYDKASSFLVSLLLLTGVAATTLFVIWFSTVIVFVKFTKPIKNMPFPAGRGDHDPGFALDPEGPGVEELDVVLDEPALPAAIEPITNLASLVAASYDSFDTSDGISGLGKGGRGDRRPKGDLSHGDNVIPPWQRWEIRYESNDIAEYRRQLDFFGIEVGAAGGSKLVDYAFSVSQNPISTRKGEGKKEHRVYLTWKPGSRLREFDEDILRDAGIAYQDRIVLQFLPPTVYDELHALELQNTDRDPMEWLKTYFKVRKSRDGYEFYIDEQLFRPRPMSKQSIEMISNSLNSIGR